MTKPYLVKNITNKSNNVKRNLRKITENVLTQKLDKLANSMDFLSLNINQMAHNVPAVYDVWGG